MGLILDSIVLSASGYGRTSGALALIAKLGAETENLVWGCISDVLGKLWTTWWQQDKQDRKALKALGRRLFSPVADRLGFEYSDEEDVEMTELRTLSISSAADFGDESYAIVD